MYIFLIQEGLCGLYETGQAVFGLVVSMLAFHL